MSINMRHISKEDWQRFGERFEPAADFLRGASLRGELRDLRRELARETEYHSGEWTATRAKRLRELEEWNANTYGVTLRGDHP